MSRVQRATEHNSPPDAPLKVKGQSVGLRWLTAAIAMPIVLACAWFGGWGAFALTAFALVLCIYELNNMMLHAGYHPLIWLSFLLGLLFLIAAMFPHQQLLFLEVGFGVFLLLSFLLLFWRKSFDGALIDWSLTFVIAFYLGVPLGLFLSLRGFDAGWPFTSAPWWLLPRGLWWLLTTLLGVWGFDAAAFFAGRYFGRHKLAPMISPAKTWEGVIGGFVLSVIAALLFTVKPLGVPWYLAIVLGIVLGAAAVIGDLAESLLKRQTHVKDSGHFMPGHGGMLDRLDSLLFAVIVVYIFAQLVGM